ncbi:MAG: hypothetical protein WC986_14130 [Elusimicrobiota bacterium]|jgi:hypothetical protein
MKQFILVVTATVVCLGNLVSAQPKEKYESKIIIQGQWGNKPGEFGLGEYLGEWMSDYTAPREFTIDGADNIYVMDTANSRVQKFDSSGKFIEQYPLEVFIAPTNDEYDETLKTWNKRGAGFPKVECKGLAWIQGQLYVKQKRLPDVKKKEYVERVLVVHSGKFVDASEQEQNVYKNAGVGDRVDGEGNRYRLDGGKTWHKYKKDIEARDLADLNGNRYTHDKGILRKQNSRGEILFEMNTDTLRGAGKGEWSSRSIIHFDLNGRAFYEMRVFARGKELPFQPNGGGMEILKWTLLKE